MKRIFYFVILLAFTPTLVNAFGLGKLDLNSALNEPFSARIQLLSPTADELDSLDIRLADSEAFARAKIDRPFILSKLRFELRRSVDDGPDYIRVYSRDPIREPFLNFLVEVSWSNGRLFREYTVLLDPPLYDPNATPKEIVSSSDSTTSTTTQAVTIDDPDHQVVYGEAYDEFANTNQTTSSAPSTTYTPSVNYTSGDYGPTTGSDTLWSIASNMRPDSSISVNKMMLALLRANPDAFINQNINGLKKGQILRAPNESELSAISNAEALAEAQAQTSAWGNIRDNLSTNISERPEVSSVSETAPATEDDTAAEEVETDAELKLVAADDGEEATEQVSSVDSGSGEALILAQESIQALTQENIELKDRVKESDALLEDLKRLLSLKDDELAALQEQMAAAAAEEEMMEEVEEDVAAAEEEMMEEVEEDVAAAEEEMMEEVEEDVAEAEEEMMEEVEEDVAAAEEEMMEEVEEVMLAQPESSGIMDTVNEYLAKAKEYFAQARDAVLGNMMIAAAIAGVIIILLIIVVVLKFRKEPAETVHIDEMTEEAFPDFDSGDLGDVGESVPDSEAVTVLPDADSEAETAMPDAEAEADFDLDEADEEKTQFMAVDDAPVAAEAEPEEEEEEEDPLQEVNTYLAFEQFDQAEEFVRNVINDDPNNPEYHSKLLEVFYTSGNKKSYEEEAKILHDIVGGEGEYWNIATAMWQEMSPNRALFEAGGDDDEGDDDADNTGGFVDVTADEEADDGGDLDFDIGGAEEAPAEEAAIPEPEEDVLDVTAAVGAEESIDAEAETAQSSTADDVLDISGTSGDDLLDLTASEESTGEDLLDVTAAVGIDESADSEVSESASDDDVLDISASGGDDLLDLTSGEESAGEDLLDVTAAANLDLDSEEDLLDVTAATSAGADSDELLDLDASDDLDIDTENAVETESNEIEFDIPVESNEAGESETVEFDIADDSAEEAQAEESSDDDNVLDFDMSLDDGSDTQEEASTADDAGLEVDLGEAEGETVRLDVEESADDMSLDMSQDDESSDSDIELDLSIEEDEPQAEAAPADDTPEVDFDFNLDDDAADEPEAEPEFDLDGTVELPKSAVTPAEVDDDDDDDDEDHTVFVPRAAQPEEQTAEDEIATKLDLAKAYVELGDKDSAKNILDEVMAEGNDEQRKQAEDLLGQV